MSDDFSARYRLLKCIAVDDGIRTHSAQELDSGRVVLVHIADNAGPDEVEQLRTLLGRLSGADKNRVLETATLTSGFAIVTEFVPAMGSFVEWVGLRRPATMEIATPPAPVVAPVVAPVAPPVAPVVPPPFPPMPAPAAAKGARIG